jgi:hypothetical protein
VPWNGPAPNQQAGRTDGVRTGDDVYAQQAAAPVNVDATLFDVHDTDLKDMINACLKKDGGNTASANIPMGGFTLTNLGAATTRTMPAQFAQLQDNKGQYVATVGGTADAITLTPSPVITAYVAGQRFTFIAGSANTGAATVNVSSVGVKDIKRNDGSATALSAGDIAAGSIVDIEYDGTNFLLVGVELGPDLRAIEALSTTGILRRSGSDTWATDAGVTHLAATTANRLFGTDGSGNSGLITVGSGASLAAGAISVDPASDTAAGRIEIAVQPEMEAATDLGRAVVPGRQHFHPGHPKAWGYATVSAGTPTLQTSYNLTSISDVGLGELGVVVATDFSSANWAPLCGIGATGDFIPVTSSQTAGSLTIQARRGNSALNNDPDSWSIAGLGDQ